MASDLSSSSSSSSAATTTTTTTTAHPPFVPPLRAHGRYILDARNNRIKLASVNWYGGSDELFIPSGLDMQHRRSIASLIRRMGFNSVRLPYSDEMVMLNPLIPDALLAANRDLLGLRALDVLQAVVEALADAGVGIILNNHITQAKWCDGVSLCDATWRNDYLPGLCRVRQTEADWIRHWREVMGRFARNPWVIGADLRNEVRGIWGTLTWEAWASAAERAAEELLRLNRDWLMIVEGISSANDLVGVRYRPVRLSVPERVVYSAHVYSWSGWGSLDPYSRRPYESFVKAMRKNWAFILEENIAPVWVGEFGAPGRPGEGDAHYWENLLRYLEEVDADFGYWALNPRKPHENARETYGLVEDNWVTIREDYRLRDMRRLINSEVAGEESLNVHVEMVDGG